MSAATPPVAGPFKTGLDWVYRSVLLLRQNPAKWLAQALLYTMLFVLLPTVPGMPVVVSLLILLLWPPILALFIGVYREADLGRHTEPRQLLEEMKPNMVRLITLGGIFLAYGLLTGFLVKDEMTALSAMVDQKAAPDAVMAQVLPLMSKILLLLTPALMASWFSPMLVAYQGFSVTQAIWQSFWQTARYVLAITAAWLLLALALLGGLMVFGLIAGIVTALSATLGRLLLSLLLLGCLLIATHFLLAIQYFSYRHAYYHPETIEPPREDD